MRTNEVPTQFCAKQDVNGPTQEYGPGLAKMTRGVVDQRPDVPSLRELTLDMADAAQLTTNLSAEISGVLGVEIPPPNILSPGEGMIEELARALSILRHANAIIQRISTRIG